MNKERNVANGKQILRLYDYPSSAFSTVADEVYSAKANLRAILRNHPNWDEEYDRIVFDVDSTREIDKDNLCAFDRWVGAELIKVGKGDSPIFGAINEFYQTTTSFICVHSQFADEKYAARANALAELFGKKPTFREGQKVSRIVNQLCKWAGIDKVKQPVCREWWDENGEHHTRERDEGYNYQFAKFADSINPITIRRHTIISLNINDFLTMSIGDNWASCHTIDKQNIRDMSHSYEGQYSGGCLSYALDNVSLIFYYVDAAYDGRDYELEPKQKRCIFMWDEGRLCQSRVYPDGRDIGDFGISAEVRNIVQQVFAQCIDVPNLWKLRKGTDECGKVVIHDGLQYPDTNHYEDCNISYLTGCADPEKTMPKMRVGVREITCPGCGKLHEREDCICCESCYEGDCEYYCERCGEGFNEDGYTDGEGHWYCCIECANRDGFMYVCDSEYLVPEDRVVYDEYDGEYHEETSEVVWAEDGTAYCCHENAEANGYRQAYEDDCWYKETDLTYVDHLDRWYKDIEESCVFTKDTERWVEFDDAYEKDGEYYEEEPEAEEEDE